MWKKKQFSQKKQFNCFGKKRKSIQWGNILHWRPTNQRKEACHEGGARKDLMNLMNKDLCLLHAKTLRTRKKIQMQRSVHMNYSFCSSQST